MTRQLRLGVLYVPPNSCADARTNVRFTPPSHPRTTAHKPSRGVLLRRYLQSSLPLETFLDEVKEDAGDYDGFNLLLFHEGRVGYLTNRPEGQVEYLPEAVGGLSNSPVGEPWEKVVGGKRALAGLGQEDTEGDLVERLFGILG